MALFLAAGRPRSSPARKQPEFLAAIQTSSSMARNKTGFLAISGSKGGNTAGPISAHYLYLPPTNPSVATLIRTDAGSTVLNATKQACSVAPVVKT